MGRVADLEGRTNREKGVSAVFGPQNAEHITSHVATIFCNHLAKFTPPKRRFWKEEQKMKSGFSQHFSRA
jgi:hypothetical protein